MIFARAIIKNLSALSREWAIIIIFGFSTLHSSIANSQSLSQPFNIISGTVTIIDRDGNDIEDRSNVVIFMDGVSIKPRDLSQKTPPTMSHKGRQFSPRVFPIVKGSTIDFFNDDSIYHNVFSLSKAKTFDLGIYATMAHKLVTFNKPGIIKLYCNIHPNMVSYILVLNNALYTKTGVDGTFEIKNIPNGQFLLRVWYELGDELSRLVSIKGGKRFKKTFAINQTKRIRGHKNKFGKPYIKKY